MNRFVSNAGASIRARAWALLLRAALGTVALGAAVSVSGQASASVSIAVQFDELVERSKAVAVIVPIEQRSVWEGRSIITYTRVQIDDGIAGDATSGREVWVVTRGGVVGEIAQHVDGEPVLRVGRPSLAFLREDIIGDKAAQASGVYIVTARAQGIFPIVTESDKRKKLVSSAALGMLYPPRAKVPMVQKALAREVLEDKSVDEARESIRSAWRRIHVKR